MGGSGGEDRGDGDDAVGGIEMQLVADPGFPEPLLLRLTPTSHWVGRSTHLVERLPLTDAGQRLGWCTGSARTPTLTLGRRRRRWVIRRPSAGFLRAANLGGTPRDMTSVSVILQMAADELLVHTFRQTSRGELGSGARDRRHAAPRLLGPMAARRLACDHPGEGQAS